MYAMWHFGGRCFPSLEHIRPLTVAVKRMACHGSDEHTSAHYVEIALQPGNGVTISGLWVGDYASSAS